LPKTPILSPPGPTFYYSLGWKVGKEILPL
jgi:hypothetical protein